MKEFVATLRHWYLENRRDLPWRSTRDPYPIWLSEIILQQTRVNQGLPYYHRFLEEFPTVTDLARAHPDKVMRTWQGLGYYSRARNLQSAARQIMLEHGGVFPSDYRGIRDLKGVGDYTAAAIASFAFGLPHAVVDGNVYRFLSRLTGNDTPIDTPAGKKVFTGLAEELLDRKDPATHNQGMMELGATVCLPVNPLCHECPFAAACQAFLEDKIAELPVKSKKIKVRDRHFHYFLFEHKGHLHIRQRQGKDIWTGLFEFPMLETTGPNSVQEQLARWGRHRHSSREFRHLLSHQRIFARFHHLESLPPAELGPLQKVKRQELAHFAFPQLLVNYIRKDLPDVEF